ncbi:toll/interleukin-1 receptor domain-containing protein [Leptolyngbya sp. CCNP1308]|uniref:toll/interleukin-1 receptor domain-containing protein n=1 Tax=Leptolyngbya sp. CCNP1308 TaxID=3110255 RepID=UPI002B21A7FB|nr:toll/interleukin-1 receptor domain-containing protein [Leptolyngbya sp. CCNP1308]MEA5447894.1 toll/interleukin-1 receptor domain-containing protein [Leptolyngbya sp. CCNP1308]
MGLEVFFSYSHRDEDLRDELEKHLSNLKHQGFISAWHDRRIDAGLDWAQITDERLAAADVILLLISADFLSSDYCYGIEMKKALERHQLGDALVIPVILRPVDWHGAPFGEFQPLPKTGKAITTWKNQDEAFLDVAQSIRQTVVRLETKPKAKSAGITTSQPQPHRNKIIKHRRLEGLDRLIALSKGYNSPPKFWIIIASAAVLAWTSSYFNDAFMADEFTENNFLKLKNLENWSPASYFDEDSYSGSNPKSPTASNPNQVALMDSGKNITEGDKISLPGDRPILESETESIVESEQNLTHESRSLESATVPLTPGNSTLYFETDTFIVSIHPRNSRNLLMNVYNRETRRSEQLNASVTRHDGIISSDWISYESFGLRAGRSVVYRASGNLRNNQARLEIVDASSSALLISQNDTSVRDFFLPGANPGPNPGQGDLLNRTVVGFDTQNHSVRVFNDSGVTKMNVYNRVSSQALVNGQTAITEATEVAPYRCWVNYLGGQNFGGVSARYFVRLSSNGQALLEIINSNGQVLLSEPRISSSPLVTGLSAQSYPACFGDSEARASPPTFIASAFYGENEIQ